ncbi:MAG: glycosyltransferase [Litorimonas sp.]
MRNTSLDVVLPTTGRHGWNVSEGWVRAANRAGLLRKAFRPVSKWGAEVPEDDDALLSHLESGDVADIILCLGLDWHSQPLTMTKRWRTAWKKTKAVVVSVFWEDYTSSFVKENKSLLQKMTAGGLRAVDCSDVVYSNHEDNLPFFAALGHTNVKFLPFSADLALFEEYRHNGAPINQVAFKGFIKKFSAYKGEPYAERARVAEYLQKSLPDSFIFNDKNIPDNEYAKYLSAYTAQINLPSFSDSMTNRAAEVLASGRLLFQYEPSGEKTRALFDDDVDLVYYDSNADLCLLRDKIERYLGDDISATRVAESGHEKFRAQFSMEAQLHQMIGDANQFTLRKDLLKKTAPASVDASRRRDDILGNIDLDVLSRVNLDKVLFTYKYKLRLWNDEQKGRALERVRQRLFHTHIKMPRGLDLEFLCHASMVRRDYELFFDAVIDTIDDKRVFKLYDYVTSSKAINSNATGLALELVDYFEKMPAEDHLDKSILYIWFCEHVMLLRAVLFNEFKYLVSFADMQPSENILAQYFNLIGKKTTTLQHGLYVDYESIDTVNTCNYVNFVSNNFLAWGQETAELIAKYHPKSNIVICGKPMLTVSQDPQVTEGRYISMIFDQSLFAEQNAEVLRIATKMAKALGVKLNLMLHPQNRVEHYEIDSKHSVYSRPLEGSEFIVGHTSSLGYELLQRGETVFFFDSGVPTLTTPDELKFKDIRTLTKRVEAVDITGVSIPQYVSYLGTESLTKYRAFFDRLTT